MRKPISPTSVPARSRPLIVVVVVLEQLAGFVVHLDGEEKARIRQARETGVILDEQALGLFVERDVRWIRPRERIMGGSDGF